MVAAVITLGLAYGPVLFLCTLKAYTLGLQHGKELGKGSVPNINLNPITSFKQYVESKKEKKQADLYEQGFINMMNYDGTPQGGDE